ncbi:Hva22-like protein i [Thalictrum thalictroides]|uniref:HVA22-like protein n=1 Tax=Thalictrum thalictroides TaxID=46969 RepID=A0A7J6WXT4_THATH|nr:Hva22-like protein i [Thalictrum thalictroides]
MVFGYAYPAYECFKTVEKNKPEIEQLRFWCQYWILVALLTVFERVGDTFISWVPMYSEAKLAFFIYLWYPKTKGTTYVYDSFFRPYIAKHETEIDRNLLELKTRAGDMAILYWQRAATYGQTRVFEVLQYVASQSTARPSPSQGMGTGHPPAAARTRQTDGTSQQLPQQPPQLPQQPPQLPQQSPSRTSSTGSTQKPQQAPSRTSSTSSTQQQQPPSRTSSTGTNNQQKEATLDKVAPAPLTLAAAVQAEATGPSQPAIQTEVVSKQIEPASSLTNENANPPSQDTVMEDVIRVTRGRLRKSRSDTKT